FQQINLRIVRSRIDEGDNGRSDRPGSALMSLPVYITMSSPRKAERTVLYAPDLIVDAHDNVISAVNGSNPTSSSSGNDIFLAKSSDGGSTFSAPMNVTHNQDSVLQSLISNPHGTFGLLYVRGRRSRHPIYSFFRRGNTFGPAQNVSGTLPSIWVPPGVAVGPGGEVYAHWTTTIAVSPDFVRMHGNEDQKRRKDEGFTEHTVPPLNQRSDSRGLTADGRFEFPRDHRPFLSATGLLVDPAVSLSAVSVFDRAGSLR
ncbi:MAG TPA: hypothetical protein VEZ90_01095, partial [Blastocatellia bacterium]|nr:hypothetical protein [Blastocatellia bacterium]